MTKADVLDSFADLNCCTSYMVDGVEKKEVPYQMSKVKIEPVYQAHKGWNTDTTSIKLKDKLPEEMNDYVAFINRYIGAPVKYISNGPGRDQIVCL